MTKPLKTLAGMACALAGVARALPGVLGRESVLGHRVAVGRPYSVIAWLACTDADWPAMLDAQNAAEAGVPGKGRALADLRLAGRAFYVVSGVEGTVLRERLGCVYVRLDDGREGWIQRELVERQPPEKMA
jgi:hypothetical protein